MITKNQRKRAADLNAKLADTEAERDRLASRMPRSSVGDVASGIGSALWLVPSMFINMVRRWSQEKD